ncbi:MAG: membrane dipeptidase [Isosphaeraceae bacterium]|nr:membrane dipeptidase [Isosphaeraceae bacterium]
MRLIDLHVDWLLQYAGETTVYDPACYARVPQRLEQVRGYLQDTSAAVLSCYRHADDWARCQSDPWAALGELITRIEAEFPGRLLQGPDDLARWRDDAKGLCWGVIGIEGFDALVRSPVDLERFPPLFERGVRLFQPVYTAANALGGSAANGDDRGLTDLGRSFLQALFDLSRDGGRPLFDLAHLNPFSAADALAWFEADAERPRRVLPVYSHGTLAHDGFLKPRAITRENLRRLRALGGVIGLSVGPPFFSIAEQLKSAIEDAAALPFAGHAGFQGIAIGTDFLGVDQTLPGLGNVEEVMQWVAATFDETTAAALVYENAQRLLDRAVGKGPHQPPEAA